MIDKQFRQAIETIQRQVIALQGEQTAPGWEDITAAVENLQLIYEEIQAIFEATEIVEEKLIQQNQGIIDQYQRYYYQYQRYCDLFHFSPIACLITDRHGVIVEANQAIARLLNCPQQSLVNRSFLQFVSQTDQIILRHKLNRLTQASEVQAWQVSLCPRDRQPLEAELHIAIAPNDAGQVESLQIGVYDLSRYLRSVAPLAQATELPTREIQPHAPLPQALDGLRVLVVDDDLDAREFVTAVLESYGIEVMAVGSAPVALEALEEFHPDLLVSDLRMPDIDGYGLIRRVRELEQQNGQHLPAAAITAYLDEDREKALTAGYEAHWHKLAQPTELIDLLTQLVGRR